MNNKLVHIVFVTLDGIRSGPELWDRKLIQGDMAIMRPCINQLQLVYEEFDEHTITTRAYRFHKWETDPTWKIEYAVYKEQS